MGDIEIALPAFVTIAFMPFTYSITVGIGAGFIMFVVMKIFQEQGCQGPRADVDRRGAVRDLLHAGPDHRRLRLINGEDDDDRSVNGPAS